LDKKNLTGQIHNSMTFLEKVCQANLLQLSGIMHEIRAYAVKNNLRPSWTLVIDTHAHACGELGTIEGIMAYLQSNSLDKIVLCIGEPNNLLTMLRPRRTQAG